MIVIKLWGGLGNQLFQYAFGLALKEQFIDELHFDSQFYAKQPKNVSLRRIELQKLIPTLEANFHRTRIIGILEYRVFNKLIRVFPRFEIKCKNIHFFKETRTTYYQDITVLSDIVNYYDGYWQTSKYLNTDIRNQIIGLFEGFEYTENTVDLICSMQLCNSVSIHIRRGDYLKRGNGQISDVEYYWDAIAMIRQRIENPVFFVFSDDISWCKNVFTGESFIFVENHSDDSSIEDLFAMSKCKHGIMSNSTYSWWGNWLKKNFDAIIIAPKNGKQNQFFVEPQWILI